MSSHSYHAGTLSLKRRNKYVRQVDFQSLSDAVTIILYCTIGGAAMCNGQVSLLAKSTDVLNEKRRKINLHFPLSRLVALSGALQLLLVS